MSRRHTLRRGIAVGMVLVPVLAAVAGPALAARLDAPPGAAYGPAGPDHPLGTDQLGRDVLTTLLQGGRSLLLLALGATILAYLLGGLVGVLAATGRSRRAEELLLRPLDVLLAIPALLLLSVAAVWLRAQAPAMALVIALAKTPQIARLVRTAALDAATSPAVEAMRLQHESWPRLYLGHIGVEILRPVVTDMGVRITSAVYLVASANFLGLGLGPASPDWAVTVARNQAGLLLQPWAVLAPATMIVLFVVGVNLLGDSALRATSVPAEAGVR